MLHPAYYLIIHPALASSCWAAASMRLTLAAELHQWTREYGFSVSKRWSCYTEGANRQVWARNYECDSAGAPKNIKHVSEDIELLALAGVTSTTIHATIFVADSESLVVAKAISSAKDVIRRRDLASRSAIEALFQEFKENNFFYKFEVNRQTNERTHLIYAHFAATKLFKL
ncbi:unnamed protein product [Phytophthora fragariaefolia]|uniref:Unnamed protein product n=1 Tax=Phytophthora fragariaefolia TaxID=1490495 RepID=A0A9W6Y2F9_9STRA|nr:unnamed protein product [Phytophthora fragariaefolia]